MTSDQVSTANIYPGPYFRQGSVSIGKRGIILLLSIFVIGGFWLRVVNLSDESLGEDEWKKLESVEDYRAHGLTGANGEHPLLLKGMLTISVVAAERWNAFQFVKENEAFQVPVETALRLPVTIFGSLSAILIFLIAAELFGIEVGLIAAALWAFDPSAIGFARIAKEDVIMTFFFMLASVFLLRSQRTAETTRGNYMKWMWLTAAAFGALMATKYMPHFLAIAAAYYFTFQALPTSKWRLGQKRWLIFLIIVGVAFLIFNPTILLPDTWRAISSFVSENRVGYKVESSYEYMGVIYRNKLTLWLFGVPWHFYYVFMAVKLPLTTIAGFLIGMVLMFRRNLGDGRYFLFWWCYFWFLPFTVLGGKFLRYFAFPQPVVMIISAIGIAWLICKIPGWISKSVSDNIAVRNVVFAAFLSIVSLIPLVNAISVSPHYRLFTNVIGGGMQNAGSYFPHDEFFDSRLGETMKFIAEHAEKGARIYSETPKLTEFHARRYGRDDITSVWLSDPSELEQMRLGDVVIDARGRRYLSNVAFLTRLNASSTPDAKISLGEIPAVNVFIIDEISINAFR
ncbi:MAG: ArnT family glycosyltransferase [Pyrinomonadaceae bacterium]